MRNVLAEIERDAEQWRANVLHKLCEYCLRRMIKRKNIKRKNEKKSNCKENNKKYAIYCDACHSLAR